MERMEIQPEELKVETTRLWKDRWLILTAGDFGKKDFNSMVVAWGSLGAMWFKPFVQVVVRPGRYTYEFLENILILHFPYCPKPAGMP